MHARLAALRAEIMERKGSFIVQENPMVLPVALYRACTAHRSRVQVRAAFLYEEVALAAIEINPKWRFVGEHLPRAQQDLNGMCIDLTNLTTRRALEALAVPEDEWAEIVRVHKQWCTERGYAYGETNPANTVGLTNIWTGEMNRTGVFAGGGWIENHSLRDYAKVLRIGFSGIKAQIATLLRETSITDPDFPRKENFWRAALNICEAGELLGRRYAEHARLLASLTLDDQERTRLQVIADTCERVPAHGARTFAEAVQALWLCHVLTCGEDGINANGIGRLDQILWPFYQADIAAGRLTREQAVEMMAELACKLYLEYDVQAITLGGMDAQGFDAVNELSYIILDATELVDFVRDLSIRLHKNSPEAFLHRACELIARGGGIPFIFNDDCFISALQEHGISLGDARDYAPIGCIELTIPGKTNPHAVSGWFNLLKCLELALFNGCDPCSGQQLGPATGMFAEMTTFEDLYAAYATQVHFYAERLVYTCNRGELAQREFGPLPCLSTLTDDCIARGRDITDGGACYNYHSIALMGTADTADALIAIKSMVFDGSKVRADQLLTALQDNFNGHEVLHQRLKRQAKYGNDISEVDQLAARIDRDFIAIMDEMHSPLQGRYVVHLFSFLLNIPFGKMVGAMPDGRLAGEPLAYSLSAHQGRDASGVTAMLNSLAQLPHSHAAGATAAIIDLDPSLIVGSVGIERLAVLIRTAMRMGIGQLQWNVVNAERLLQAQRDPEHYGNIAVRIAGYSQQFKLVERELQDHIIARTKHRR